MPKTTTGEFELSVAAPMRRANETYVRTVMAPPRPPPVDLRIVPLTPAWEARKSSFQARRSVESIDIIDLTDHTLYPYMIAVANDGRFARPTVRKPKLLEGIPSLRDASEAERHAAFQNGRVVVDLPSAVSAVNEPCVLLGSGQSFNYYHWLIEFIAKLDLLLEELEAGRRLVIPRLKFPYHGGSLRYFGIDPDACLFVAKPRRFRDLRITSAIAKDTTKLSSFIGTFFQSRAGLGGRKIYVSRGDAKMRRVINEDNLASMLTKKGFEIVRPGELSFANQVNLFKETSVVVGAHGAGLTNAVFMPIGSQVIELVPDSFDAGLTSYAALSEERKFRHSIVLCPSTGLGANADMFVSLGLLSEVLDQ